MSTILYQLFSSSEIRFTQKFNFHCNTKFSEDRPEEVVERKIENKAEDHLFFPLNNSPLI